MPFHLAFAPEVVAALLAIMKPIAKIPVFLALTDGADAATQREVAAALG